MFCTQCGARNDETSRFCISCGAAMATVAAQSESETRSTPPANGIAATAMPTRRGKGRLWIIIAIATALIAACVATFLTYRAELWGGRSLPDAATIAAEAAADGDSVTTYDLTAEQVARALKRRGMRAEIVHEFAAQERGLFLGYAHHHAGQRLQQGTSVGVRVSDGPGVPEGTVGQRIGDVIDALRSMNVPVQVKQVMVSDTSQYSNGQVVATNPAEGQAVSENQMAQGITVGVASQGDGIPFDIVGTSIDQAQSQLESLGYTITLEPRFTSRDYIGKISGSSPGPGSPLEPGQAVTLYYGIGAESTTDALTTTSADGFRLANGDLSFLAGQYCKADTEDGEECVTLEPASTPFYSDRLEAIRISGHEDSMVLYGFTQDISGMVVESDNDHGLSADTLPMRNHLLLKGWGMFEIYAGLGVPRCGTHPMMASVGEYCDNGVYHTYDPGSGEYPHVSNPGTTYDMQDFLVYFPVGSNISALESSGYFDSAALSVAKTQDAVNTDRPFILLRDPNQYDQTSIPTASAMNGNPFVPSNRNGVNPLVPMKPAISNDTVYYLVESTEPDWQLLPDAPLPVDNTVDDESGNAE